MLEKFFTRRFVVERFRASPVGVHIDGFATSLFEQGYSAQIGSACLHHAVHLGHWMESRRIALDEMVLALFVQHFPSCDCDGERIGRHESVLARVRAFRGYLEDTGVVARPVVAVSDDPLLTDFITWMRQQRGASACTIKGYVRVVRRLLAHVGNEPSKYTTPTLRKAVRAIGEGRGLATRISVVTATRTFLRQLAVRGRCSIELADGIPRPARWSQTTLPKHLPGTDVEKLFAACDLSSATGLRDRAVLLLLARLGLRAGDVVELRLTDLDWKAATIRLVGKGRHEARLPLPQDVGDALLAYIDKGRPRVVDEHIFLRARAPWGPLQTGSAIGAIVDHAIRRAGVNAPSFGSHLLRHSAATSMLREGASLDGIASILRHRSPETTLVYARVHEHLLGQVAQPWPSPMPSATAPKTASVATPQMQTFTQPWLAEVSAC